MVLANRLLPVAAATMGLVLSLLAAPAAHAATSMDDDSRFWPMVSIPAHTYEELRGKAGSHDFAGQYLGQGGYVGDLLGKGDAWRLRPGLQLPFTRWIGDDGCLNQFEYEFPGPGDAGYPEYGDFYVDDQFPYQGGWFYQPTAANPTLTDSITYTVVDTCTDEEWTSTHTWRIADTQVLAVDDSYAIPPDRTVAFWPLENDRARGVPKVEHVRFEDEDLALPYTSRTNNGPYTIEILSGPTYGELVRADQPQALDDPVLDSALAVRYVYTLDAEHDPATTGTDLVDEITYRVTDADGDSDTATVGLHRRAPVDNPHGFPKTPTQPLGATVLTLPESARDPATWTDDAGNPAPFEVAFAPTIMGATWDHARELRPPRSVFDPTSDESYDYAATGGPLPAVIWDENATGWIVLTPEQLAGASFDEFWRIEVTSQLGPNDGEAELVLGDTGQIVVHFVPDSDLASHSALFEFPGETATVVAGQQITFETCTPDALGTDYEQHERRDSLFAVAAPDPSWCWQPEALVGAGHTGRGTLTTDGTMVTYQAPNELGSDALWLKFSKPGSAGSTGGRQEAWVPLAVTVISPTQPIAAHDYGLTYVAGRVRVIDVLANDVAPPGTLLTVPPEAPWPDTDNLRYWVTGDNKLAVFDRFGSDISLSYRLVNPADPTEWAEANVSMSATDEFDNAPPVAGADVVNLPGEEWVDVNVLENDSDPDGDLFSLAEGSLSLPEGYGGWCGADGACTFFVAGSGASGAVATYTVVDVHGLSATGLVTLNRTGPGDPGGPKASAPSVPQAVKAVRRARAVELSWTAPASNGGAPLTQYVVSAGGKSVTVGASIRKVTVTGLTAGARAAWSVQARNSAGTSSAATGSVVVIDKPGKPSKIAIKQSARGQTVVSWKHAATSAGKPRAHYEVYLATKLVTKTKGNKVTLKKQKRGTRYTVKVVAVNEVGKAPALTKTYKRTKK